jgi:uncharacterized protein (TIGR03663 family)
VRSDGPAWERLERWAWGGLLLVSLALRLWDLGSRAYHHDESIHGHFTYDLATQGIYKYDPVYHGPVQYFMVATAFRLLGDSDFTARLPAALGGVGLVAMAMLLRARFGRGAAFASGVLLAVSPNLLYFTRFCREDVWSLLGTFGLFLWLDRWWRTRRVVDLGLAAVWGAVAFASKENFYVLGALMVPSVLAAVWEPGKGFPAFAKIRSLLDVLERHGAVILGAIFLFFTLSEVAYTFFLVHTESGNPAFIAISYWWGQHKVERVGGPPTFYLPRILQYEFAIVLPALAWIGMRWRRFSPAERFVGALALSSVLMYAYLGEKTPWLIVHQVLPFVPLAGTAWAALCASRVRAASIAVPVGVATVVTTLSLSFWNPLISPFYPRAESVIFTQTAPELMPVVADVVKFAATGADPAAAVFGEATWPLSWYFRRLPIYWAIPNAGSRPPYVIVDDTKADEAQKILGGDYVARQIPLRAWWIPEVSRSPLRPTARELLTYLFTRRPWSNDGSPTNPVGSQNVVVLTRPDLARSPGR